MAVKKFKRIALAALLALALVLTVSPCALATDEGSDTSLDSEAMVDIPTDGEENVDVAALEEVDTDGLDVENANVEDTDAADTDGTEPTTDTESAPDGAAEGGAADTSDDTAAPETEDAPAEDEKKSGISTGTIVSIAIVLLILVVAVIYCVTNREKVGKFFREVKSELKKIVWTPWKQVKKNTLVVIIVVVICAAGVAICDFVFSKGIFAVSELLRKIL